MPRQESEENDAAPPPPGFSMPKKVIRNDGAGHADSDAEGPESESDADVEKEFDVSTGKKRNYAGPHSYRAIKQYLLRQTFISGSSIQKNITTKGPTSGPDLLDILCTVDAAVKRR